MIRKRRHTKQGSPGASCSRRFSLLLLTAFASAELPLYASVAQKHFYLFLIPMMNVLNGGVHADNNVDFRSSWCLLVLLTSPPLFAGTGLPHLKDTWGSRASTPVLVARAALLPDLKSNEEPARASFRGYYGCWRKAAGLPGFALWTQLLTSSTTRRPAEYDHQGEGRSLTSEEMVAYYEGNGRSSQSSPSRMALQRGLGRFGVRA